MVDTVTTTARTTMGNDNDDWEVAVDTGELDKRLEQQEKARALNQESAVPPGINDDDSRNNTSFNLMNSNKPIRILKRPTSQSHLSTNNDVSNSSIAPQTVISNNTTLTTITSSSSSSNNDNNTNDSNSYSSYNSSSSTTVPAVSIIPRNQTKDSINLSESIATPVFSSTSSSTQSTKPAIKTYEQRELEYRLARLRIMGEEESSAKDDDDIPTVEVPPLSTDDNTKTTLSSTTRSTNKMNGFAQLPLQCHSTPGSYASDLYALNTVPSNTGTIHFTPNNNTNNNSTSNLGIGPFSSPNFPQHYRNTFTGPYSHLLPTPPGVPRYPIPATTTNTLYMTSTAPFISAPSSSVSSSYHYPPQQHPNFQTNNWYHYQHPQTPYGGTQQYGHPQ